MAFKGETMKKTFDAVVFDVDSTLTQVEGIVELAKQNGCGEEIEEITQAAMDTTGMTEEIYAQRLQKINPTSDQVNALGEQYYEERIPEIKKVLSLLLANKEVYLVSAGLFPAVSFFAKKLGLNDNNVYAVNISFDENGNYIDFDRASPLVKTGGKRNVLKEIKSKHNSVVMIGDGSDDLFTKDVVDLFIGFGGVREREMVKKESEVYISSRSMLPVLEYIAH